MPPADAHFLSLTFNLSPCWLSRTTRNKVRGRSESMKTPVIYARVLPVFALVLACLLLPNPQEASGQVIRPVPAFRAPSRHETLPRATAPLPRAVSQVPSATAPLPRAVAPVPSATAPLASGAAALPPAVSELPPPTAPLPPAVEELPPATAPLPQATSPLPPATAPSSLLREKHRRINPPRPRPAGRWFNF